MQFDSWQAFWTMGGYGFFVWLAFGVSFCALAAIWIDSVWAKKRLIKKVQAEQARKARILAAKRSGSRHAQHDSVPLSDN